MAQLPKSLQNFTVYVDGTNYAGRIAEGELPKLELTTQEVDAGGLAGKFEVDAGRMEAMTLTATLKEHSPEIYRLFGSPAAPVTFRAAQGKSVDTAEAVVVETRGLFKSLEPGALKGGEETELKIECVLTFLRIEIGGTEVVHVDIENMIRKIGGTDQMQAIRTALGG